MHIDVTGRHLDVTQSLKTYVVNKMDKLERHFDHVIKAHVILGLEKPGHKAEATLQVSGGHGNLFADSIQDDMYAAIDTLIDKLDRQVIKHKEKISNHNRKEKHRLTEFSD